MVFAHLRPHCLRVFGVFGYMKNRIYDNNAVKRRNITVFVATIVFLAVLACYIGSAFLIEIVRRDFRADVSFEGKYKNIILMIGDGMGFAHIDCAENYYNEPSYMRTAALGFSEVITDSDKLFFATDSAASATALSTGKKTDNGAIARLRGKNIPTNAELAKSLGMAVGIIATEGVNGATPAAFSSHADNRGDSDDIFAGQLRSNIDLFAGGNRARYDELKDRITESGYEYLNDFSSDFDTAKKIWGAYDIKSLQSSEGDGVTLAELAVKAMNYLENVGENGYFMMIEESYIDKRSHANDIYGMLEKFKSYDQAVKAVVERARTSDDTLVIVTADHETGKLFLPLSDRANPSDKWFKSAGHTRRHVPCFYYSPVGELPRLIDNTQIADMCRYFIENR